MYQILNKYKQDRLQAKLIRIAHKNSKKKRHKYKNADTFTASKPPVDKVTRELVISQYKKNKKATKLARKQQLKEIRKEIRFNKRVERKKRINLIKDTRKQIKETRQ